MNKMKNFMYFFLNLHGKKIYQKFIHCIIDHKISVFVISNCKYVDIS